MSSLVRKIKGMPVKQKMLAGFGAILLILALIAVQTLLSLLAMKNATTDVMKNREQTVITSMQLAEHVKDALGGLGFFLLSKEKTHKQQYLAHLKMADAELQRLKTLQTIRANPQAAMLVTKIVNDVEQFKSYQLVRTRITPLMATLNDDIRHLVDMQVTEIESISGGLAHKATETAVFVIVMLLLAMGAVATLAFLLMRGIIRPMTEAVDSGMASIRKVVNSLSQDLDAAPFFSKASGKDEIGNVTATFRMMSSALQTAIRLQKQTTEGLHNKVNTILEAVKKAAQGDLTFHLEEFHGRDAIDELAANVQIMIENLNTLVAQVQESGIQVMTSATEIAATAKQQEATATEQAASTNQIMATLTEISTTTKELVATMEEVVEVADNTAQSASNGQSALTRMGSTMRQMREATDAITAKLAVLNEKAGNISNVVTTINKVADQTNLLSLNAAIEAEKAGEYGRGFAVVATEIRRLADQTAAATWDIEQMVKEMQSAVSAGVMGMDKFSEEVSRGAAEVGQVGSQLTGIIDQVQTLTPRFDSVNQGMQSQARAAGQISESMSQLNETAHQTAESLRQSNASTQQLKDAAQGLQSGVRKFRIAAE